jgi:hypothetical protein
MDEAGKADVRSTIEGLRTECMTNLWDGLKMGMTLLCDDSATASKKNDRSSSRRLSTVFILTDGMPNITPPRGHNAMLKAFLESHPMAQPFSISTFGFGYSLDSQLLLELAQIGGGSYGFIPDSGMVGTVFIHAVANMYSTYAPRAHLDIELPEGTEAEVKGALPVIKTSWGIQIDAGDIQFGQSREFVVIIPKSYANISVTCTFRPFNTAEDVRVQSVDSATLDLASIKYHAARLDFVDALFAIPQTNSLEKSVKALKALQDRLSATSVLAKHDDALALVKDISGEGLLALRTDNFERWGRHYLPSLARAHQRQQSGNFKDPGLQVYGRNSTIFVTERDKLDAAFDALPPPTPSLPLYTSHDTSPSITKNLKKGSGSFGFSRPTKQLLSMSMYNTSAGPCFAGECSVEVPGGIQLRVEQLKRGMEIETMVGPRKVAAIVRTAVPSGEALLCKVGNLLITPWHPFVFSEKWSFPADIVAPEVMACDAVYSVLLLRESNEDVEEDANAHTIFVGGMWCVTLGHGITSSAMGDVRAHAFLGNYEKVVGDISFLDGFHGMDGIAHCAGTKRSGVDQHICGFFGEKEAMDFGNLVMVVPRISEVHYV